jgi:hypothetical protein
VNIIKSKMDLEINSAKISIGNGRVSALQLKDELS